ncbi:MAG: hypothetical protein KC729_15065 [Candidatus Eisenbacteria bacterium]|uniref:HEAT repeat domain-containing protein n=1 Tax=Eiseniibacteriota bacterium TaxID=2212470 RepID=A0A956RPU1_UNCEI|nr:hypothetical protein [Candidatus Eisenbacteria bacterium]
MSDASNERSVLAGKQRRPRIRWSRPLVLALASAALFFSAVRAHGDDPCNDDAILQTGIKVRLEKALELVRGGCMTIPGPIWTVVQKGSYSDGNTVSINNRILLIDTAIAAGYVEAESLAVSALEGGKFPDGTELAPDTGAALLEGLGPALTPYRIGLLLDVYEQVNAAVVRDAVIRTLRNSDRPEALLPALDASWRSKASGPEARKTFAEQPEKTPDAILARVIGNLPEGPALDWAIDLAQSEKGELSMKAAQARGK